MYFAYLFEFILFIILIFFPLGLFVVKLLKINALSFWGRLLIAVNLGSVIFAIFIFILWLFKLYLFSYIICLLPILYLISLLHKQLKKKFDFRRIKIDVIPFLTICLTVFICSLISINSGDEVNGGLRMIGANAQDGLNFLALEQNLQKSIPPENPSYSGVMISNYHYLVYILISAIQFITKIPLPILNFKIIVSFFVLLYSASIYFLIYKITKSKFSAVAGVLLASLSSNIYYLAFLVSSLASLTPSVFWVNEYLTRLVNPQLLFSYVVILLILLIFINSERKNHPLFITIVGLLIGSLIAIKAFAGILILGSLLALSSIRLINKDFSYLKLLLSSLFFTAIFYLLSGNTPSSILILSPLWFIKNMYETKDHLNLADWELRRQLYLSKGNFLRVIELYAQGLTIFLVGNLGGRLLGFLGFDKNDEKGVKDVKLLLIFLSILSIIFPLLFLVKGTAWNSIQFFYYSIFSLSLLTTFLLSRIYIKNKIIGVSLFAIIFLMLISGVYYSTNEYLQNRSETVFTRSLYQSALFLKDRADGIVMVDPAFTNNSFISAISGKTTFYADEMWLSVQLISYNSRKNEVNDFFASSVVDLNFLAKNHIKYIFTSSNQNKKFSDSKVKEIYTNENITIYEL